MESPYGVMVNVLSCDNVVSDFELQSFSYIHVRTDNLEKGINPIIFPAMGSIVSLLFVSMHRSGIRYPTKVDMPSNNETRPNRYKNWEEESENE